MQLCTGLINFFILISNPFGAQSLRLPSLLSGRSSSNYQHKTLSSSYIKNKRSPEHAKLQYRVVNEDDEELKKKIFSPLPFRKRKRLKSKQIPPTTILNEQNNTLIDCVTNQEEGVGDTLSKNDSGEASENKKKIISNVDELRSAILEDGFSLQELDITQYYDEVQPPVNVSSLLSHDVLKLIEYRVRTNSKPGRRDKNDTGKLALSIEGGGMRGSVSAGMAAAIATLGLCDAFDSVYGSSAGSVVGAYMISRQMCVDVYTDVIPTARKLFVSKRRLISSIVVSIVDNIMSTNKVLRKSSDKLVSFQGRFPPMNISYVLDSIMCPEKGLRPIDFELFMENDQEQPLRVVSSAVHNGELDTVCFSSKNGDFSSGTKMCAEKSVVRRKGLFACLEASMTVPGATGPPVNLRREKDRGNNIFETKKGNLSACFDAFCLEAVPYRSAVEEGATHVLALRTRPEGCSVETKPGFYEKTVSPLYFNKHGFPEVSRYFARGGQQYRYLEDIMTLDEGRNNQPTKGGHENGVRVPPTDILYGVDDEGTSLKRAGDVKSWKRAHLLPIVVPEHKEEMQVLENSHDEVLKAVRDGFAAAFDMLAPVAGLELDQRLSGDRVAELVFPNREVLKTNLLERVVVGGDPIFSSISKDDEPPTGRIRKRKWLNNVSASLWSPPQGEKMDLDNGTTNGSSIHADGEMFLTETCEQDAARLLSSLPGLQAGKFSTLALGLELISNRGRGKE